MTRRLRLSFLTLSALLTLSAACGESSPTEPQKIRGSETALPSGVTRVIQSLQAGVDVSSPLSVNPSPASDETQQRPAVAQGLGVYFVVWEVNSTDTGSSPDIVGVRVQASDGALLDSSPISIATGSYSQTEPAVAFDGTNFTVVWTEDRGVPAIYGRRVSASTGALIDSTSFFVSNSYYPPSYERGQNTPSIACDGTNCLVTWYHAWSPADGVSFHYLEGSMIRASDGTHTDTWIRNFSSSTSTGARVTFARNRYLVAWMEGSNLKEMVFDSRTGGLGSPVTVTTSADSQVPGVAGQGSEFLVTWLEAGNILARRVDDHGALLGSASTLVGTNALAPPSVTADAAGYHVLWDSLRDGVPRAISTRLSPLAEVIPNAELDLGEASSYRGDLAAPASGLYLAAYVTNEATVGPRVNVRRITEGQVHIYPEQDMYPALMQISHNQPTVSVGNGVYLIVWYHPVSGGDLVLQGLRVRASDGQVLDSAPLTITHGYNPTYSVAFDGTNFLVVWTSYAAIPTIYGARVRASDGAVLDSSPLRISFLPTGAPAGAQEKPAVAFDGTNYLVTWQGDGYDATGTRIYGVHGIRVSPYASLVDSNSFLIGPGGSNSRVAYSDGKYLVTWEKGQNIEAARINASTRQVLDSPAISVAASSANENSPAVAGQGGQFLVAWVGANNTLWARRVSGLDGSLLGSGDTSVGPAPLIAPEVTFDGRDYWIGWQGTRNGLRQIFATRVTALGTLESDSEIPLTYVNPSTSQDGTRGGIAAAGPGHFLSTYLQYDPTISYSPPRFRLVSANPGPATPLVSEARASWAGCDYAIQARQDTDNNPYPHIIYRLLAQVSADASGTCAATPTSTSLGDSQYLPALSIVADDVGVAAGYSEEFSYLGIGTISNGFVAQLDPSTLGIVRRAELHGSSVPTTCEAGSWGSLAVGQLTLANDASLVVEGTLSGNIIALSGLGTGVDTTTPCDGRSVHSTTFTVTLPGFFTTPQAPSIVIH